MRSNVQDLIHLGISTADTNQSGPAGRSGRSRIPTTDSTTDSLSFDLLLALAATFPPSSNQPEAGNLGLIEHRDNGQLFQGEPTSVRDDAGGAHELATGYWRRVTNWQAEAELFASAPPESPITGATVIDCCHFAGAEIHSLFTGLTATGPDTPVEAGNSPLLDFRSERFPAPVEFARPQQTNATRPIATSELAGGDGSEAAGLHLVARNDEPLASSQPARQADLRVIYPDGSLSGPHQVLDLVDRLAAGWRSSFLDDDLYLADFPLEHSGPRLLNNDEPGVLIDEGGLEADLQPTRAEHSSDNSQAAAEGDPGGQPGMLSGERSGTASLGSANQPPAVIPLFGNLMAANRVQPETSIESEPAIGVPRAVVEIASETFQLEQTGGSEISFTLKLAPEHLGQIEIDIQRVDNRWTISITTAGNAARDALAAEVHRLEHAFRERNLALEKVSVVIRNVEQAINAPTATEQAADTGWFGGEARDFAGENQNWDESGRRAIGEPRIIAIESSDDVDARQAETGDLDRLSLSGIDIKA